MSALPHLIKMHRRELERRQRRMTAVDAQIIALRAELEKLDAGLTQEARAAALSPEASAAYSAFFVRERARRKALQAELEATMMAAATVREEVAETFKEVKSYELIHEGRLREARRQQARQEAAVLDELGLAAHRRKRAAASDAVG